VNPEAGFFGVAPGTGEKTNPNAMATVSHDTILTNTAKTDDGDTWWEGMTEESPSHLIDWRGRDWTPDSDEPAAHPNSRFTVGIGQCPTVSPEFDAPTGVPIDAFLFGGRRATVVPLVQEAFDWEHGVFIAATMSVETTAAASGAVGQLRFDPMAMLPFCGYNMADYFRHWLEIGRKGDPDKLPRIFLVNWFRKDDDGKFMWPGFGENIRVLEWVCRRCDEEGEAWETATGLVPPPEDIDTAGLDISEQTMRDLLAVDPEETKQQIPQVQAHLAQFGHHLPDEIQLQFDALKQRLDAR
jgi:phosphoenolpyruvate carboxykinase (GTP)